MTTDEMDRLIIDAWRRVLPSSRNEWRVAFISGMRAAADMCGTEQAEAIIAAAVNLEKSL